MDTIDTSENEIQLTIEVELVDLQMNFKEKGKTLGCWGPSPDDGYNQC
ncbi:hypothetical protein [Methylovulum sp.]|nr:hypothetical protein [Methylovulum sp.]MDD2801116.1 hypothetical protein [Methylococcales bacterium]MDD5126078.1 hypothetical protein [Methylovulum sp.]